MSRNSLYESAPQPLDVALGLHVRMRRKELGMSQSQLGEATGITFQQIQKYEIGANRISFSRLVEIAHALACSVEDLTSDLANSKPTIILSKKAVALRTPGAIALMEAYMRIPSIHSRKALLKLARQLAGEKP